MRPERVYDGICGCQEIFVTDRCAGTAPWEGIEVARRKMVAGSAEDGGHGVEVGCRSAPHGGVAGVCYGRNLAASGDLSREVRLCMI